MDHKSKKNKTGITYNKKLDKLSDKVLFPEKLAETNKTLSKTTPPKRKS